MKNEKINFLYAKLKEGDKSFIESLNSGSEDIGRDILILSKIARSTSESDFSNYLQTGDLPAMKLTREEMEVISGGMWQDKINDFIKHWADTINDFFI